MAGSRELRRLAFQALFQFDAQSAASPAALESWLDASDLGAELSPKERAQVTATALAAFAGAKKADQAFVRLAPTWPAHRQAAVDRAILRLAFYEMHAGQTPPKVVINDAVELAKEFSTDRSPSFINGLLDRVFRDIQAAAPPPPPTPPPAPAPAPAEAPLVIPPPSNPPTSSAP